MESDNCKSDEDFCCLRAVCLCMEGYGIEYDRRSSFKYSQ